MAGVGGLHLLPYILFVPPYNHFSIHSRYLLCIEILISLSKHLCFETPVVFILNFPPLRFQSHLPNTLVCVLNTPTKSTAFNMVFETPGKRYPSYLIPNIKFFNLSTLLNIFKFEFKYYTTNIMKRLKRKYPKR